MLRTNISGETMIFKNDKGFYSTSISKKIKNPDGTDGGYDNAYLNVNFTHKTDIPNQTRINVTNGWLSFNKYTDKDGVNRTTFNLVISEFTPIGGNTKTTAKTTEKVKDNSEVIGASDDDDLPF